MKISEFARQAGVTIKAVRYYEQLGLLAPSRLGNGYREYTEEQVHIAREIRALATVGIPPAQAGPFVDCLRDGHKHGDECPESLAAYRDSIAALDRVIAEMTERRKALNARLQWAASRTFGQKPGPPTDYTVLPTGLPIPVDDGAAQHLPGAPIPDIALPTSGGGRVRLTDLAAGRTVIYLYPLTGRPGYDIPEGWDAIPGARGCTTEACNFRDHFGELKAAGASQVWGLSSQSPDYQAELVRRLNLPFGMLSDQAFALGDALGLPTFSAAGHPRLYARLTLIIRDQRVEHAFYPVFPPNTHAEQVSGWLRDHPIR